MFQRRVPEFLRHAPTPGVRGFAVLAATESTARGILISVFPIVMYRAFGDAVRVSEIYLLVGILSLFTALITPWMARFISRRWLFTLATLGLMGGALLSAYGNSGCVATGLALMTTATVIITVCFNAYVMDYIARSNLGHAKRSGCFIAERHGL